MVFNNYNLFYKVSRQKKKIKLEYRVNEALKHQSIKELVFQF